SARLATLVRRLCLTLRRSRSRPDRLSCFTTATSSAAVGGSTEEKATAERAEIAEAYCSFFCELWVLCGCVPVRRSPDAPECYWGSSQRRSRPCTLPPPP